ncbi:MAG TPA: NAD(P)/FAD-dependent oxidoreductase [Micromonosporaceae bacterium]|nr:NAD(P)/FAD-dependent oxidoreductase [Micromonosporaceae bacterium]
MGIGSGDGAGGTGAPGGAGTGGTGGAGPGGAGGAGAGGAGTGASGVDSAGTPGRTSAAGSRGYDVIVVGGGHNGLVAAAYLARAGRRVLVCERRPVLGGAAVSEHPFGPDYTVTSLSYVVSLLPADMVRDLRLTEHGYHVYPQGPYFAPHRDGRYLRLPDDRAARHAEIAKFAKRDAGAYERWESWLGHLGGLVGPLLEQIPPKLGSKRPRDLIGQAGLAARLRGVDVRAAYDLTKLFTASIADLVEERFESDAMRGVLSVSGVIGTWAGPRSAGTAYVMLHHHVGDTAWGFPRGGMGGVTAAIAAAARGFGAHLRTDATVARIDVRNGRTTGVTLASGEELRAPVVITTAHPQISFLRLVDRAALPAEFVADIESWQTRSGTVKINLAVDRLPRFAAYPDPDPSVYGGTIVLAESLDDVEGAFGDAVAGRPATLPFADVCIPSVYDDSLAPAGRHVVSMFTQWVPHTYASDPDAAQLEAYADRVVARMEAVAPGFTDSIVGRQVIGPHQMETEYGLVGGNIFHGELTPGQMFHCRPAAGFADLRTPIRGLYQAGSATHGGGGVTGIPGRNVVRQVLADRRKRWW